MVWPRSEGNVLGWDGGLFGGIDFRGRPFLPLGAVKFQDGLQRDFANVLLEGELFAVAVFLLVDPRAELADQLNVHATFQCSSEFREPIPRDRPVPVRPGLVLALGVLPRALRGKRQDRVFGPAFTFPQLCVRP